MTIETKFNPDDVLWAMIDNKPKQICISTIQIEFGPSGARSISYISAAGRHYQERELFASKEELRKHIFGE